MIEFLKFLSYHKIFTLDSFLFYISSTMMLIYLSFIFAGKIAKKSRYGEDAYLFFSIPILFLCGVTYFLFLYNYLPTASNGFFDHSTHVQQVTLINTVKWLLMGLFVPTLLFLFFLLGSLIVSLICLERGISELTIAWMPLTITMWTVPLVGTLSFFYFGAGMPMFIATILYAPIINIFWVIIFKLMGEVVKNT